MSILTKYVLKRLITVTLVLALMLIGAVWLTQSLRFIEVIVNKDVSLGGYFSLVVYLIPDLLVIILPVCILISTLYVYNRLISDHELAVFRALGLSNQKIVRPALILSIVATLLISLINIYVIPASFRHFRDKEHQMRNEFSAAVIKEGVFNTIRGITVYLRSRAENGELRGIFIHNAGRSSFNLDDKGEAVSTNDNPYTIIAEKGILKQTSQGISLVLFDGNRQEKDPQTGKVSFFHFQQFSFNISNLLSSAQKRAKKPYERSLLELLTPEQFEDIDVVSQTRMRAEAHQRIITPFFAMVDALIGVVFLLQGDLKRTDRKKRILLAIVTSLLVHTIVLSLINLNSQFYFAVPLAYVMISLSLLIAFISLGHGKLARIFYKNYR